MKFDSESGKIVKENAECFFFFLLSNIKNKYILVGVKL